jgi:hypothetical protein
MSIRIQIDFAKPAWYSIKHATPLGAGLVFFSSLLCIWVFGYSLIQQRHQPPSQLTLVKPMPSQVIAAKKADKPILSDAQSQILFNTVTQLNAPWNRLLTGLESLKNPDVALISILPNQNKQELELTGEARNIKAMLSYIESLEVLPMLEHVALQKHQVNETNPYQPVEFVIVAKWR